jgi:hypothetical protein
MSRPWVSGLVAHVRLQFRARACTSLQLTGRLVQQRPRRCTKRQWVERRGRVGSSSTLSPRKRTLQALWACGLAVTSGDRLFFSSSSASNGSVTSLVSLSAALGRASLKQRLEG